MDRNNTAIDGHQPVIITDPPTSSGDPRVYADPYLGRRGSDLVRETCGKCGGDGVYHAPSGFVIQNPYAPVGVTFRGCFDCMGVGHRYVKVSSVRSRIRRAVKAQLQRDADAEAYAAEHAARQAAELAEAWEEALAEDERRAALNNEPVAAIGEKITGATGVVEVSKTIEVPGFRYGTDYKRLVVVKLQSGQVVKTFGAGEKLFGTRRGDRVTITRATVKAHETYQGQLQTVVIRLALQIDAAVPRSADVAEGDTVEKDGIWYEVHEVRDWSVSVVVDTEGERTMSIGYHELTGHRPATP
ncbi:hypothetical protein A7R75_30205 [Mycolicibacterium llatzerense]|nr:hypothetical protein [Mycolicibacterium llatzerense]